MLDYEVSGLKYVPVKVKTSDYEDFKKAYTVVENDGTLVGGYGEFNLQSYNLTADVTANTNGLKTATKNEDGTFSFSARANWNRFRCQRCSPQKSSKYYHNCKRSKWQLWRVPES